MKILKYLNLIIISIFYILIIGCSQSEVVSFSKNNDGILINLQKGTIELKVITDKIIRYQFYMNKHLYILPIHLLPQVYFQ